MKRFLLVLTPLAIVILAAVAAAQDTKDKAPPSKDKAEPAPAKEKSDKEKSEKQAPEKAKSDKEAAPAAKSAAAEAMKESPYYPLQVGNRWDYRLGDNHYSMRVAKHEKVGDYMCARVEMMVDDKVTAHEHIADTNEGVVRVAYDDRRSEPPLLFLKLPPAKDQTWKVDSVIGKTDKSPGEKVSGSFKAGEAAKVSEPAGTFENVVTSSSPDLDANGLKLSFTYYFAKGTGMVKQEIDVGGQKVIIDLEKFEQGK